MVDLQGEDVRGAPRRLLGEIDAMEEWTGGWLPASVALNPQQCAQLEAALRGAGRRDPDPPVARKAWVAAAPRVEACTYRGVRLRPTRPDWRESL